MLAGRLEIEMVAGIARLQSDMNQAKSMVGSAMGSIEKSVASAERALGALGVGLSVGYFVNLIKGSIDAADHLNDLSQRTGIAVKDLAKYELATKQSGTTMEALSKGIKGISVNLLEHGDALKKAGLNATTADGAIRQLADLFQKMPDGLEKTALAVKLFGKSGMDLIPMLNMGSEGLDKAAEKSAKYAATMAALAPQADEFNDNMAELGMLSKLASITILNDLVPSLIAVSKAMTDAGQKGAGFWATMNAGIWAFEGEMAKVLPSMFESTGSQMQRQIAGIKGELNNLKSKADFTSVFDPFKNHEKIVAESKIVAKALADAEDAYKKFLGTTSGNAGRGNVNPALVKPDISDWRATFDEWMKAWNDAKKTGVDSYEKIQDAADKYVATLLKEADQLGMTDKAKALYNMTTVAMTLNAGKERDSFVAVTTALIDEIDAYKKAVAIATERAALRQKESDGIEAYMQAQTEGYAASVKGAQDATLAAQAEYEQLGLTKSQIADITLLKLQEMQLSQKGGIEAVAAREKEIEAIKEQIGWLKKTETKQAGIDTAKKVAEEWKHGWEETDRIGRETFIGLTVEGKTFAETVGKTLKTSLAGAVYDLFARPIMLQLYTSVMGSGGAGGGAMGIGSAVNSASGLNTLWGAGSQYMTGATAGSSGLAMGYANTVGMAGGDSLGALISANGGWAGVGGSTYAATAAAEGSAALAAEMGIATEATGAAAAATTGLTATLAAIPWYGWAALAAIAVFGGGSKGGPKSEGGYAPNGMNIAGLDIGGNQQGSQRGDIAAAQTISAGIVTGYQTVMQQLGIKDGKIDVGVFYAKDPAGDSQTQLQIVGGAYNRSTAMGGIENAGRTDQELQDAIAISAAHLVLTNLQASDLPAYLEQIFNTLTDSSTAQQINDAVAFATGLKQIRDALTETRTPMQIMADDMKALGTTADTFKTDFIAAIDAGINPEKLQQWQALGQEITQLGTTAEVAAVAVRSASDILNEHTRLQDQYDQLTMTSAQLLDKQRSALDASNVSLFDQVQAAQTAKDAATALAQANLDAAAAMQAATDASSSAMQTFIDNVMGLVAGIHSSVTDSIFSMNYGLADNPGKYGMLDSQAKQFDDLMRSATDINVIAKNAQLEIDTINKAFALLDQTQQASTLDQNTLLLTKIDNFVTGAGADAISIKKADNLALSEAVAKAVESAMKELAQKMTDAAIAQASAASKIEGVIREPAQVNVTVTKAQGTEVSVS